MKNTTSGIVLLENTGYLIYSDGRVWSTPRKGCRYGRWLSPSTSPSGYMGIQLGRNSPKYQLHLLVAKYFLENPYNFSGVNHKDGNRQNNDYTNLEWSATKSGITKTLSKGTIAGHLKDGMSMALIIEKYRINYEQLHRYMKAYDIALDTVPPNTGRSCPVSINCNYHIYDDGRLWSVPRYGTEGGFIKPLTHNGGYRQADIGGRKYLIHRLVAEHFIDNPLNLPWINHIDGNKTNNHHSNLEWVTNQQNMDHARRIGLFDNAPRRGEDNATSKLTESDVTSIRSRQGSSKKSMALEFNVSETTIGDVRSRRTWRHI